MHVVVAYGVDPTFRVFSTLMGSRADDKEFPTDGPGVKKLWNEHLDSIIKAKRGSKKFERELRAYLRRRLGVSRLPADYHAAETEVCLLWAHQEGFIYLHDDVSVHYA